MNGRNAMSSQASAGLGAEEHHAEDDRLHQLCADIRDDDDELAEVVRVGGDARDDAS